MKESGRGSVLWAVVAFILGAAALFAVIILSPGARQITNGVAERTKAAGSKEIPSPQEALPGAPGPDNTIQTLPPQPGVPAQPPSPVQSETDLSKNPARGG